MMVMMNAALTVLLLGVYVSCHDCKRFHLTPSDQMLIDMMKHYLHSSRKTECKAPAPNNYASTYTRWGRKMCPGSVELVYSGQAGGMKHNILGGGVNTLCLPNDPENGHTYAYENDVLYGSEYELGGSAKPSGLPLSLYQKEIPCAVCRRHRVSSIISIPGRKTCYKGWNMEYTGFLMASHKTHYRSDFICMDKTAEPLDSRTTNDNDMLLYPVRAKCGSLRCPPYKDGTEVYCVVCSK